MRNYLPQEFRRRFHIAWRILPVPVRQQLDTFVISVRETDGKKGTRIRQNDGTFVELEIDHGGCCMLDLTSPNQGCRILLNHEFGDVSYPEAPAIVAILHELSHAYEDLQDNFLIKESRRTESEEASAWLQVASWALRDPSGYKEALNIASCVIELAYEEITKLRTTDKIIDEMLTKFRTRLLQETQ